MKALLAVGAIALAGLPAAAIANSGEHPPGAEDKPGEVVEPESGNAQAALHALGRGRFVYRGSGGISVQGTGVVTIRSDIENVPSRTAEGFESTGTSDNGTSSRYRGQGTLTVNCSACKVVVRGRFEATVNPTDANMAIGVARVRGRGYARLAGGHKFSFHRAGRLILSRGPLDLDLFGRGARPEEPFFLNERGGGHVGDRGARGERAARDGQGRGSGRHAAGWRLSGPANGSVAFDEITGRLKVKDLSDAKDLVVTVPDGTSSKTRDDGAVVYEGLEDATGVTVVGTAFRMIAKGSEVDGTFLPADGSIAQSVLYGRGAFSTPDGEGRSHRRRATRLLLQGVGPPPPAAAQAPTG